MTSVLARSARPLVLVGALVAAMGAHAARSPVRLIAITSPAGMAPTPAVSNLAKECEISRLVGEGIFQQLTRAHPGMVAQVSLPKLEGDQRALQLTVVNMFGLGGGNYSGPKWMVIRAEVVGPDGVISARDFRRVSAASFSGLFLGTCHVMGKVAAKTGADIRKWLQGGAPGTPVPTLDEDEDELRNPKSPPPEPAEPPASAASS